jgi:multicomponent Na+:H+ antiporter subunit D
MQSAQWLPVLVIVLSTALNAGYFLPIVFRAFFAEPVRAHAAGAAAAPVHEHGEAPWPMVAAMVVTAAATVMLFFAPDIPVTLAKLIPTGSGQ